MENRGSPGRSALTFSLSAATFLALALFPTRGWAQTDISLDQGFRSCGVAVGPLIGTAGAVAFQAAGKVVIAGCRHKPAGRDSLAVAPFNSDVSPDEVFGDCGVVVSAGALLAVVIEEGWRLDPHGASRGQDFHPRLE